MLTARIRQGLLLLASIFVVGTLGYMLLEGADVWDAFYMTGITLTTVGYREVFPLSRAGQVFTVLLATAGLGLLLFLLTEAARAVFAGEINEVFGRVRRLRMLEKMSGHEIVCGYGRMGEAVVIELVRGGRPVVVIERSPEKLRRLISAGLPVVDGDATSEEVLRAAGTARRGLVACLNDDAHNVYTVLTARSLNPGLFIVARAGEESAESRMLRAGADRVVNPYQLGGLRLAHMLAKPAVVDFLDVSLPAAGRSLELEQVRLQQGSALVGSTLGESDLRRRWGVGVVAVRRGEQFFPNPDSDFRLEAEDELVVLGGRAGLESLELSVKAAF
ncbi:MAG TPA: potassium channel protein [Candidatus Polarisedimenticolaceae bacterium]|nr:potassium channel protein [Candidatus Polarisedimenticolaceae bacterium]